MMRSILNLAEKGIRNPKKATYFAYERFLEYSYRVPSVFLSATFGPIGKNVFSEDWDLLIILDTGRVDALTQVADEYEFITNVNSVRSVGAATSEWIAATFTNSHINDINETSYICANGCAKEILDNSRPKNVSFAESYLTYKLLSLFNTISEEELQVFENIWRFEPRGEDGPRGHKQGGPPPRYVTDRAITHARVNNPDRLICHYHQPHAPYTVNALKEDRKLRAYEDIGTPYLTEGGNKAKIWNAYLDELRYVLDDVELLLTNIDAEKVIISADHGNAFGELGVFSHPIGSLHPKIRQVPWITTTGTDTNDYNPETPAPSATAEKSDKNAEQLLQALGYKF
jgi:hypothetical protein